jgi:hypothetical protein
MPKRKQRKKRQKELRHEWEEVYVDSEGRELEPEEVEEILPAKRARSERKPERRAAADRGRGQRRPGARTIQPPSWRRVLKRAALFAPLMYVFLYIVSRRDSELGPPELLAQTVLLLVIFMPFSYLMDTLTYRLWKRRQAGSNS